MTHFDVDGERSRVRLSFGQLAAIIATVASGAFLVVGAVFDLKGEQQKLRSELSVDRDRTSDQLSRTYEALRDLKLDRAESLREWQAWRTGVNEINARQDSQILQLQSLRRE